MKFQGYKGKDKKWYLRLKARNGKIILDSEGYATKGSAKRAAKKFGLEVEWLD